MRELTEEYKTELKRRIEVMQAAIEGRVVQYKNYQEKVWITPVYNPLEFNWIGYDYRVKPEPKRIFRNVYKPCHIYYHTREEAEANAGDDRVECEEYVQVFPEQ